MPKISQAITVYTGQIPDVASMDQSQFDQAAIQLTDYWLILPPELSAWAQQANNVKIDLNAVVDDAITIRNNANDTLKQAKELYDAIKITANFKGEWAHQSGALNIPSVVFHDGDYWNLLFPIADVTAHPPNENSPYWAKIKTLAVVRRPDPITPVDGDVNVFTTPTLDATGYANIYDSDVRAYRRFEVKRVTDDWSAPVYSFESDSDSHQVTSQLDMLENYQWRCRDVADSGEASTWSIPQSFATAEIYIDTPNITHPVDGDQGVMLSTSITTSAFSVANGGVDTHHSTDWVVLREDTLETVWESLADSVNKTSVTVPFGHLDIITDYRIRARHRGVNFGKSAWAQSQVKTVNFFVEEPSITTLSNGDDDVTLTPTLSTTAFVIANSGSDTHTSTDWQVSDTSGGVMWESINDTGNKTSITLPSNSLVPLTDYIARVRYHSQNYGASVWHELAFTTAMPQTSTPSITSPGTSNVSLGPSLSASPFSTTKGGVDTHTMTDWVIKQGGTTVWSSLSNTSNKTSISVPSGTLDAATNYDVQVRYHGALYGWSGWQTKAFTTVQPYIESPDITANTNVDGYLDPESDVTFTTSAFNVVYGSDTHASTDWEIRTRNSGGSYAVVVWSSIGSTSNLTSVTVPSSVFDGDERYRVVVKHNGAAYGSSSSSVEYFNSIPSYVEKPSIPTGQDPSAGVDLTASAFVSVYGNTQNHSRTRWWIAQSPSNSPDSGGIADYAHYQTPGDTEVNLLNDIGIPQPAAGTSTLMYAWVRYEGSMTGWSEWSDRQSFYYRGPL